MKIAIVASLIVPERSLGIEHFAYGLIGALVNGYQDVDFHILIPRNTCRLWASRVRLKKNMKFWEVYFSPTIQNAAVFANPQMWIKFYAFMRAMKLSRAAYQIARSLEERFLLRKIGPDLVYYPFHRHSINTGSFHKVVTVHDLRPLTQEFFDKENAGIIKGNIRKSQAVISSWQHPYEHLIELFPSAKEKSFLIPFPLPMARQRQSLTNTQAGESLLLYSAIITPHKNHLRLIQALRIVVDQRRTTGQSVRLICTGTKLSPLFEEVLAEVKALKLEDFVEFPGFISDDALRDLYSRATMVVAPTLWEAASGAVYEAFTYEKPVACSNIAPLVSQVKQCGGSARFFDPKDCRDIADAILEILENPLPFIEGARRGSKFLQSLTWEKTARQYMQVFKGTMEHQSR